MKALVLDALKEPVTLQERPDFTPGPNEAVVRVAAASLNRRDYWITQGLYPGINPPVILGSDAAGIVSAVGAGADESLVGHAVLINPGLDWGDSNLVQDKAFRILGTPDDGVFATEACVPTSQLHLRPDHLDHRQASCLPIAGVTAYRGLFTRGHLQKGDKVLVSGIGGGVAVFALQFALAAGAEVFVSSSSEEKIERAKSLGATAGYNYKDEASIEAFKEAHGDMHLAIDGAGGNGWNTILDLLAPGGRLVTYGSTAGNPDSLQPFKIFWRQISLLGTTMGSPDDFKAMLAFVSEHQLEPIIDEEFPLEQGNEAIAKIRDTAQFGKIVLQIG